MPSNRYALKDDGYPTFKKIVSGRKWVGRVCSTKLGHYLGIIGNTTFKGATEEAAFRGVVAKHLGFDSSRDLAEHNANVRATNNRNRAIAQHAVDEIANGNFKPLDLLFDREAFDRWKGGN